jgi:hypothetical protein
MEYPKVKHVLTYTLYKSKSMLLLYLRMSELKVHFLLACHDLTHNVSPANQTLFIAKPNMKHQCFQDQMLNEKLINRVQKTISGDSAVQEF